MFKINLIVNGFYFILENYHLIGNSPTKDHPLFKIKQFPEDFYFFFVTLFEQWSLIVKEHKSVQNVNQQQQAEFDKENLVIYNLLIKIVIQSFMHLKNAGLNFATYLKIIKVIF